MLNCIVLDKQVFVFIIHIRNKKCSWLLNGMINFSIFAIQNVCIKSPDRIKSSKRNVYNTSLCILRV